MLIVSAVREYDIKSMEYDFELDPKQPVWSVCSAMDSMSGKVLFPRYLLCHGIWHILINWDIYNLVK